MFTIRPEFGFLAVADGMGGTSAGHIAARITVDEVSIMLSEIHETRSITGNDMREAVIKANAIVHERGQMYTDFAGMGTTLVAVSFHGTQATFCHVGDSRAYLFRKRELSRITKDHSAVQELVDKGEMTPEEARTAHNRNLVTRAIGPYREVDPEITVAEIHSGDCLMMCSDGVSDFVPDSEIQEVMHAHSHNLRFLTSILVETADRHGSTDNITTVVAKVP